MDRNYVILQSYKEQLFARTEIAFDRSVEECVGGARSDAPVGMTGASRSNVGGTHGSLAGSIHRERTQRSPGVLRTRFGSSMRHARMREKGGVIVPVRAKLLSWIDPATGKRIFAKRVVQAPGGRRGSSKHGKPYLKPNGDRFPQYMSEHLRSLFR